MGLSQSGYTHACQHQSTTFGLSEVCLYGSVGNLDEANQEDLTLAVSDEENPSQVLGDTPVALSPDASITIEPSSRLEPDFTVMDLEITVEGATSVTFYFYDTNGTLVDTVEVKKTLVCCILHFTTSVMRQNPTLTCTREV